MKVGDLTYLAIDIAAGALNRLAADLGHALRVGEARRDLITLAKCANVFAIAVHDATCKYNDADLLNSVPERIQRGLEVACTS